MRVASTVKDLSIVADEQTNALVITAQPDVIRELERWDCASGYPSCTGCWSKRIIVEVQDGDTFNLGVQWANTNGGGTNLPQPVYPQPRVANAAIEYNRHGTLPVTPQKHSANPNGLAVGFDSGNWAGLVTALSSNTKSNILATP